MTFSITVITARLLPFRLCHYPLLANYTKSLRRSSRQKQSIRATPVLKASQSSMIPYLSRFSLQSQSSLLWLPDPIIIQQSFSSRNSSKRLNNKSTFLTGVKKRAEMVCLCLSHLNGKSTVYWPLAGIATRSMEAGSTKHRRCMDTQSTCMRHRKSSM